MRTRIKRALILSAIAATGFSTAAMAADTDATSRSSTSPSSTSVSGDSTSSTGTIKADHKTVSFLKDAVRDNDEEIALAEVGIRKAQNAELKSYAEMLQKDHTEAQQKLQPLAQKYGVDISDSMKHKENREVTKFEKESGAKFDQEFATRMLKDHEKDIQKYQKASTDLQTPDVKQFAESMVPKLREHFTHAEAVAKAVGVDQSTISSYSKRVNEAMGGTSSDTSSSTGSSSTSGDRYKDKDLKSGTPSTPPSPNSSPR